MFKIHSSVYNMIQMLTAKIGIRARAAGGPRGCSLEELFRLGEERDEEMSCQRNIMDEEEARLCCNVLVTVHVSSYGLEVSYSFLSFKNLLQ